MSEGRLIACMVGFTVFGQIIGAEFFPIFLGQAFICACWTAIEICHVIRDMR